MWVVIKKQFVPHQPIIFGGKNAGQEKWSIDRVVDSLDEVKKGETFFKCNIKN